MRKVCETHNVELRFGTVEIRRGFPPAPPEGYIDAEKRLFPHANTFEMGGCLISPDDKDTCRKKFCPDCREAKAAWMSGLSEADAFWA